MLKLTENPAVIPPGINSLAELAGKWWVAYTKSRFEKVFAWEMMNRNIGYFLPMHERVTFSGNRKRHVMLPLFTSYVFFCGSDADRYTAMATGRLSHIIDIANQDIFKQELLNIEKAVLNKAVIDNFPRLALGSGCRIKSGPMKGTEGVVIERDIHKTHMVIEVTILGQGVVVEIDNDLLESIG